MVMTSTQLDTVQTLFQSTIQAMTPSIVNRQADAWSLKPANRRSTAGQRSRAFHIAWENDQVAASAEFAGWTTGSQVNEVFRSLLRRSRNGGRTAVYGDKHIVLLGPPAHVPALICQV